MTRSVLIVAPYLPLPATFGGALRIYNLIVHLSNDHQVSLLAPGTETGYPSTVELGAICDVTVVPARSTSRQPADRLKRVTQIQSLAGGRSFLERSSYNPQMQTALDRLFMIRRIDLVQFEFPESSLYTLPRPVPTVFDAHNVEHDLLARVARSSSSFGKRAFNMAEARKVKRLEVAAWEDATLCLATSDRDATLMGSLTSTPVEVVPNGVDLDAFHVRDNAEVRPHNVVFTGAMRHRPNADGARWYAQHVHHLVRERFPGSTFSIVGADPPAHLTALASPSIEVTGEVADIRPHLARAQIVVVPLWSGGGTRLKMLEAFAAGRPVVSTTLGAEGIDARDGRHVLIADDPASFATAVVRLLEDPDLVNHLVGAARKLVEDRYGWGAAAARLRAAYDRATATFQQNNADLNP